MYLTVYIYLSWFWVIFIFSSKHFWGSLFQHQIKNRHFPLIYYSHGYKIIIIKINILFKGIKQALLPSSNFPFWQLGFSSNYFDSKVDLGLPLLDRNICSWDLNSEKPGNISTAATPLQINLPLHQSKDACPGMVYDRQ